MPWTGTQIAKGGEKNEIIERLIEEGGASSADAIVHLSSQDDEVWYAAVRDSATGNVSATVILTRWADDGWFHVKLLSEEEGPMAFDPPKGFLDLLSWPSNDEANAWRDGCRQAKRGAARRNREARS